LKQYTDVEGADFSCLQCSEGNVAVGFRPRNYTGTLFTSGFSLICSYIVNAFEAGDNRKAVAILDFKDWAAKVPLMVKGMRDTFNRKYIPRKEDLLQEI
jgi:hypothetical protein